MTLKVYPATALTGGAAGALDAYDGSGLADGEIGLVFAGGIFYAYLLDDDSGAAESSPTVIAPDANAGDKRWILQVAKADLVNDTTPQLGGMLDVNGQSLGDGTLELLKFSETALAVNEITLKNAATGDGPEIQATGDDTDINVKVVPKGAGGIDLSDAPILDSNGNEQIKFSKTASAVNELTVKNAATGSGPEIQATGGDANIDLELVPKGTGGVNLLDALLVRPKIKDYSMAVYASSSSAGAVTLNLENGNVFTLTLTENITSFSITNWLASTEGGCTLYLTQAASAKTVAWGTILWDEGLAPDITTASSKHVIIFSSPDGGTTKYGFHSSKDASVAV